MIRKGQLGAGEVQRRLFLSKRCGEEESGGGGGRSLFIFFLFSQYYFGAAFVLYGYDDGLTGIMIQSVP